MSGSSFGHLFKVTTFGESHGPAIGCIVDGMPAGLPICDQFIQTELDKRKPGQNALVSPRCEKDTLELLSGVLDNTSLGTPICMLVRNHDAKSKDYDHLKHVYRPGHGDYTYQKKYGIRDWRGGGRASARETVARVMAGALAKQFLNTQGVAVYAYLSQVGEISIPYNNEDLAQVQAMPYFCPNPDYLDKIEEYINHLMQNKDSCGAKINVVVKGVPAGLGQPVFDKLEASLAKAVMSIPAVKGVEFGAGFDCVTMRGSEHRDPIHPTGFGSNHAGGILAGISNGQDIHLSLALKPTSSIGTHIQTIDNQNQAVSLSVTGRHDPCVGLRASGIATAMVACVIADHWLMCFGESHLK